MARNWETNPHPLSGEYRTLSSGRRIWIDERGVAHFVTPAGNLTHGQEWDEDAAQEEAAHADFLAEQAAERYWEERGNDSYIGSQEEARERYLEGLAEAERDDAEARAQFDDDALGHYGRDDV